MATKKITLNELRSIVKQIIKESDLGDVYAAYSNANELAFEYFTKGDLNEGEDDAYIDGKKISNEEAFTQLEYYTDDLTMVAKAMETMVSKGEKPTEFLLELSQNLLNSIKSLSSTHSSKDSTK